MADITVEPRRQQPELLRVIDRVSQGVAGRGHDDLLRVQFEPLRLADLRPTLAALRRSPEKLTAYDVAEAAHDADLSAAWLEVTPVLVLHRAGAGIMTYHVVVDAPNGDPPGLDAASCISRVRLGIQPALLDLPDSWQALAPPDVPGAGTVRVLGVRDLSHTISERLCNLPVVQRRRQARTRPAVRIQPARPTGSTTVVLTTTEPPAGDPIDAFVSQYAGPLRGIGALDTYFSERATWIVERELADNLSTDRESAVYLLGNSELILFNDMLPAIQLQTQKRLGFSSPEMGAVYLYMHYVILMEWVYLQEAILRSYIQRLDMLAAAPRPQRAEMVRALHGALADLVQYQEDITPYTTRIDFLERARRYHKIDELAERFERKQSLLLSYASEYHDFREARAAEFLNWLAAILAGGELGNLIVNATGLTPDENVPVYLAVTLGSIGAAIAVMLILRLVARRQ